MSTDSRQRALSHSALAEAAQPFEAPAGECVQPRFVVAIGASAGGLEPIERIFENMPDETGMAFVVIQHLSPNFKSLMKEILNRHTPMTVRRIEDGMPLARDTIYLSPPRKSMVLKDGCFRVYERQRSDHGPIDLFMRSLAEGIGSGAIGIVLSGSGSDGSRGVKAIRERGGLVLVQDPETAKFDSMPRSALSTGVVRIVGPANELPGLLINHIDRGAANEPADQAPDAESEIIEALCKHSGVDFNTYKKTTLRRRMHRRAMLRGADNLEAYNRLLKSEPEELDALYQDMLIGVTAFFRDPEAFAALERAIDEHLIPKMTSSRPLRVWVPGCASGEEAYSVAMLFVECAKRHNVEPNVKIFATDMHERSLQVAGDAIFGAQAVAGLSEERLRYHFERHGCGYRLRSPARRLIVCTRHNLIGDPPFSRIDLVSCRNLLIYLGGPAQLRALSLIHFALVKDGLLFMGLCESPDRLEQEFKPVDVKARIYRKTRDVRLTDAMHFFGDHLASEAVRPRRLIAAESRNAVEPDALLRAYDTMLARYAPASLLVDERGTLLHIFGNSQRFVRQPPIGRYSGNIIDLVLPSLSIDVADVVERCRRCRLVVRAEEIQVPELPHNPRISVHAHPLSSPNGRAENNILLIFEEVAPEPVHPAGETEGPDGARTDHRERMGDLSRELAQTNESLQTTVEELESSNEELQASHEQLVVANEALQSANEELHSLNEELHTVSSEHQRKIDELTELTNDIKNLLLSTQIGVIFVDHDFNIRRFTPPVVPLFNLAETDIGRPLRFILKHLDAPSLFERITTVLNGGPASESEFQIGDGRWFLMRVSSYLGEQDSVKGAVLAFVDIHAIKSAQAEAEAERERYEAIVQDDSILTCRFGRDLAITFCNGTFQKTFSPEGEELIGREICDVVPFCERREFKAALPKHDGTQSVERQCEMQGPGGLSSWQIWSIRALGTPDGRAVEYQALGRDISTPKRIERRLAAQVEQLKRANAEIERFSHVISHDLSAPVRSFNHLLRYMVEDCGDQLNEDGKRYIELLQRSADRMREMLNGLLSYVRIGYRRNGAEDIDLTELARKALKRVDLPSGFELTVADDMPALRANRESLGHVLLNLVENAVKHHDRQSGRIDVRASTAGEYVVIEIEDDGPGIAPHMREQAFDIFKRLKSEKDRNGHGLGLALVKKTIDVFGGWIELTGGAGGRGTIARFAWPRQPLRHDLVGEEEGSAS